MPLLRNSFHVHTNIQSQCYFLYRVVDTPSMPSVKLLFLHRAYINLARELARLPNFVFFVNKAAQLFFTTILCKQCHVNVFFHRVRRCKGI
jgi:hypothetical protein